MITAKIDNTDEIICSMRFTLSLKDWKQIQKTLRSNAAFTELKIINPIDELVGRLEKTLYVDDPES